MIRHLPNRQNLQRVKQSKRRRQRRRKLTKNQRKRQKRKAKRRRRAKRRNQQRKRAAENAKRTRLIFLIRVRMSRRQNVHVYRKLLSNQRVCHRMSRMFVDRSV